MRTPSLRAIASAAAFFLLASMCPVAGGPAQAVQQPTSRQEESLRRFLRDYLGAPDPSFEPMEPTLYSAAFVDLKDDGTREVIVYVTGRAWCGSGGCITLVLAPKGSSYTLITEITITRPPIRALISKSHGWHDITVVVQGGGIIEPYEAKLSFDGETFPSNPTVPPAQELTEKVPGKVVVPLSALTEGGKRLYP
jgi:hypothetical protein